MKNLIKDLFLNLGNEIFIYDSINEQNYTYSEFLNLALVYYNYITERKQDNIQVAILLENSVDLLAVYIACLLSNSTAIPIDIKDGSNCTNLDNYKYNIVIDNPLPYIPVNNINIIELIDNIDFNKPFLITHTSGTSGKSKGVIHSFANLYNSAKIFATKHHYDKNSIFYHNLPMTYMAGILNQFIMPFISKSKIVLGNRFSIRETLNFWQIPVKYKCNVFWLNPTIISLLNRMDRGETGINYLKNNNVIISVGTAPLYENIKHAFETKYNIPLYRSYGLSETLFVTTQYNGLTSVEMSNGEILDGISIDINENNEILISTPWNFLGYTDTGNTNKNNIFSTGDTGYIANNQLFITGRVKDIIIRGGINISPILLENTLMHLNIFEETAIIGYEDDILTEKIICYYVSRDKVDKEYINSSIIKSLGNRYKIDEYIKMDELPKNSNNKIDKIKLRKLYADRY